MHLKFGTKFQIRFYTLTEFDLDADNYQQDDKNCFRTPKMQTYLQLLKLLPFIAFLNKVHLKDKFHANQSTILLLMSMETNCSGRISILVSFGVVYL